MKKPRIAVCLTGQVRNYNQYREHMHTGLQATFEDWADYDLFGHTWEGQPTIADPENFTGLSRTDQNDIWDNIVRTDLFTAMIMTSAIVRSKKYQDMFINGTDHTIQQWMKEIIIGIYSQIASSWESFAEPNINNTEYDAYIKFRWDMNLIGDNKFRYELQHFINTQDSPAALLKHDEGLSFMPDVMIIFNKAAHKRLLQEPYSKQIEMMGKDGLLTDHTHGLWKNYLDFLKLDIKSMTHNPNSYVGFDKSGAGDQTLKWNKQWGL